MNNIIPVQYLREMKLFGGYSLFELIIVILLIGILAAYAVPRLEIDAFQSKGFFQQSLSSIRFAQKQAIATGCNVQVQFDSGDSDICELM